LQAGWWVIEDILFEWVYLVAAVETVACTDEAAHNFKGENDENVEVDLSFDVADLGERAASVHHDGGIHSGVNDHSDDPISIL